MPQQRVDGGLSTRGACYAEQKNATEDTPLSRSDLAISPHTDTCE